jgi:hypothetical protein
MATWREVAGKHYSQKEEDYINKFNFEGGGSYGISKHGLYYIGHIYREPKCKIRIANLILWLMWIKRNLVI